MADERPLPTVPVQCSGINGAETEQAGIDIRNEFFREIIEFLGYPMDKYELVLHTFAKVDERILGFPWWSARENDNLSDRMSMLIVQNVDVASMISLRNSMNNPVFSFALYLNDKTIERTRFKG